MYFLWPGVLAAVLQVLLLGLALAFASENGSFKKKFKMPLVTKIDER
jgi:hypothetical protein